MNDALQQLLDKLTALQGAERNQKCEVVAAAGEFQKVVRVGAVGVHEVEEKAAVRKFTDKPQLSGVCGNALGRHMETERVGTIFQGGGELFF